MEKSTSFAFFYFQTQYSDTVTMHIYNPLSFETNSVNHQESKLISQNICLFQIKILSLHRLSKKSVRKITLLDDRT
mgnify:CR=1 FL=1